MTQPIRPGQRQTSALLNDKKIILGRRHQRHSTEIGSEYHRWWVVRNVLGYETNEHIAGLLLDSFQNALQSVVLMCGGQMFDPQVHGLETLSDAQQSGGTDGASPNGPHVPPGSITDMEEFILYKSTINHYCDSLWQICGQQERLQKVLPHLSQPVQQFLIKLIGYLHSAKVKGHVIPQKRRRSRPSSNKKTDALHPNPKEHVISTSSGYEGVGLGLFEGSSISDSVNLKHNLDSTGGSYKTATSKQRKEDEFGEGEPQKDENRENDSGFGMQYYLKDSTTTACLPSDTQGYGNSCSFDDKECTKYIKDEKSSGDKLFWRNPIHSNHLELSPNTKTEHLNQRDSMTYKNGYLEKSVDLSVPKHHIEALPKSPVPDEPASTTSTPSVYLDRDSGPIMDLASPADHTPHGDDECLKSLLAKPVSTPNFVHNNGSHWQGATSFARVSPPTLSIPTLVNHANKPENNVCILKQPKPILLPQSLPTDLSMKSSLKFSNSAQPRVDATIAPPGSSLLVKPLDNLSYAQGFNSLPSMVYSNSGGGQKQPLGTPVLFYPPGGFPCTDNSLASLPTLVQNIVYNSSNASLLTPLSDTNSTSSTVSFPSSMTYNSNGSYSSRGMTITPGLIRPPCTSQTSSSSLIPLYMSSNSALNKLYNKHHSATKPITLQEVTNNNPSSRLYQHLTGPASQPETITSQGLPLKITDVRSCQVGNNFEALARPLQGDTTNDFSKQAGDSNSLVFSNDGSKQADGSNSLVFTECQGLSGRTLSVFSGCPPSRTPQPPANGKESLLAGGKPTQRDKENQSAQQKNNGGVNKKRSNSTPSGKVTTSSQQSLGSAGLDLTTPSNVKDQAVKRGSCLPSEKASSRRHVCVVCQLMFTSGTDLLLHRYEQHSLVCGECDSRFLSVSALNQHKETDHPRILCCHLCRFATFGQDKLDKHMQFEHDERTQVSTQHEAEKCAPSTDASVEPSSVDETCGSYDQDCEMEDRPLVIDTSGQTGEESEDKPLCLVVHRRDSLDDTLMMRQDLDRSSPHSSPSPDGTQESSSLKAGLQVDAPSTVINDNKTSSSWPQTLDLSCETVKKRKSVDGLDLSSRCKRKRNKTKRMSVSTDEESPSQENQNNFLSSNNSSINEKHALESVPLEANRSTVSPVVSTSNQSIDHSNLSPSTNSSTTANESVDKYTHQFISKLKAAVARHGNKEDSSASLRDRHTMSSLPPKKRSFRKSRQNSLSNADTDTVDNVLNNSNNISNSVPNTPTPDITSLESSENTNNYENEDMISNPPTAVGGIQKTVEEPIVTNTSPKSRQQSSRKPQALVNNKKSKSKVNQEKGGTKCKVDSSDVAATTDTSTPPDSTTIINTITNNNADVQFQCQVESCALPFSSQRDLRRHAAEAHRTKERRYRCDWPDCEKSFFERTHLRTHMLLHTEEKPVACTMCDYRCRQRTALVWHMRKHGVVDSQQNSETLPSTEDKI